MIDRLNIGFLGTGKMGGAIARGLMQKRAVNCICAYDPSMSNRLEGVRYLDSVQKMEAECDLILLCVKPQDMEKATENLTGEKKYISIAAGVSTERIQTLLKSPDSKHIARAMPNLSASIGSGVTGVFSNSTDMQGITAEIFSHVGFVLKLDKESLMHALTGISGSGPAFILSFLNAMAEGGVLGGLSYDQSIELAAHTMIGTAKMILESGEHPGKLRNSVTSPAGTTIQGLYSLEKWGFNGAVMEAVNEARKRSEELGS